MTADRKVFISYAREDMDTAKRLYKDMKQAGAAPWLDVEDLLPGQKWRDAITRTIKDCRFFITLLSSDSLSKRGYVQKELKLGLDALDEYPARMIPLKRRLIWPK